MVDSEGGSLSHPGGGILHRNAPGSVAAIEGVLVAVPPECEASAQQEFAGVQRIYPNPHIARQLIALVGPVLLSVAQEVR